MKRYISHLVIALIGFPLLLSGPLGHCAEANQISWSIFNRDAQYFTKVQADPKRLVEEYCEAEFNGVQDIRLKVVRTSSKQVVSDRIPVVGAGEKAQRVINFSNDSLVVVDSYQVRDVTVTEDLAEATVVYKRLASCDGTGNRKYVVDRNGRDVVKLKLESDGSRWWIVDPPLPRVSKWALIEFSERIISSMNEIVKAGKASDGQKKYYQGNKDIVVFLRAL